MKYATPLPIELRNSRQAAGWLLLVHFIPLVVLPALIIPFWFAAALAATIVASLWWNWRRHVNRRYRDTVISFVWKDVDECMVQSRRGNEIPCKLLPQAFAMPWLVILYYRRDSRRQSLFILPDMLPPETFRRLRVRLKLEFSQLSRHRQA